MKYSSLLLSGIVLFLFTACGTDYDEAYYDETYDEAYYDDQAGYDEQMARGNPTPVELSTADAPANNYRSTAAAPAPATTAGGGKVIMHPIHNPKAGMESGRIPLPAAWKLQSNAWITPDGGQVQSQPGGMFMSHQRQVNSIDQIIREDLLPQLQQRGHQILGTSDLPAIARKDQQMYAQYWKVTPTQDHHAAKAIDYRNSNGDLGLLVVHFTLSRSEYGNFANYYLQVMETGAARFEQSKRELLYGLANMESNPQYIAAHNRREQQKSQASWSAHNSRMQSNQQSFDRFQQTQRTLSEVGDIYHEGYMNRSRMNDAGHERTIDGIRGEQAGVNPYGGQQVKVESGYKYYYMNQYGEYIGSNDEFSNPATDPRVNNQQWRQVQGTGGGY